MAASIIDGAGIARALRLAWASRVQALSAAGRTPGLAVVKVGDDPASAVYVRNKVRACAELGIHSELYELPASASQEQVLERVSLLNANPAIHGILVQLPLPGQIDEAEVLASVAVAKDVDGFHLQNLGALVAGRPGLRPCTPAGVMYVLDQTGVEIAGRHAVVVGRSTIVGKPMALLLLEASATVTVCTSRTRDLAQHTRDADILVVAVGRPGLITGDMVKPGAVVIDVGINRLADGKLCGDVDFASAREVAGSITPVPGGVGPMTIAMLLGNTLTAAEAGLASR